MSTDQNVKIDERTVAVEYASYKWAYIFISYALFIDVAYRAAMRNEAAWDLMALVIGAAAVSTIYQARQKTLSGWIAVLIVCSAGFVAAFIAAVYKLHLLH